MGVLEVLEFVEFEFDEVFVFAFDFGTRSLSIGFLRILVLLTRRLLRI